MSEATKQALEDAIAAHVADECDGDMSTSWLIIAETTSLEEMDDNRSSFYIDTRDLQSLYTTDGLLYNALNRNVREHDD